MSKISYFWQGGSKIKIQQDDTELIIHAENETEVRLAAMDSGIELGLTREEAPGLQKVSIIGDSERSINQLRSTGKIVHRLYRDTQAPENEYIITESFFIKFKPNTPNDTIQEYFNEEHLTVEQSLGNSLFLVRVSDATGRNPIRAANAAANRIDVEYAEPNLVRKLERFAFVPPDTLFSKQWHLNAPEDELPELVAGAGIFAPEAWDISMGRREIVVAVADDGFDLTHPDFQGQGKVLAQLNAQISGNQINAHVDWDNDVHPRAASSSYASGDYHGTPCLGVAVAEANGGGVVGVAPKCSLVAVRFPLSMTDAHLILMFRKISPLADIVSCSWGVGPSNNPLSSALYEEIGMLSRVGGRRGKGLIFCVAAGNNNCPVKDLDNTRTYNVSRPWGLKSYSGRIDRWIAAHPDVITISASTSRKNRAAYSSWGEQIWVCAPSDNFDDLREIKPIGRGITTTDNEGFGRYTDFTAASRFTGKFGGTSSATPTVAGVCALILSANPLLSGEEVKEILKDTADKDLSMETDTPVYESGEFNDNGFSLWFGHGKVNAYKAVQEAEKRRQPEKHLDIEVSPDLEIPDKGVPIVSEITIEEQGKIIDVRIRVDIHHTYIGDLRVDLIDPEGKAFILHNNTGGTTNDLVKSYTPEETSSMNALIGKNIQGKWKLRVRDTLRYDIGRLNSWRITAKIL